MNIKLPFNETDIMCPCGCFTTIINNDLLLMVFAAIRRHTLPLVISSWVRCPEYNKLKGGVYNSGHLVGEAIDIHTFSKDERFKLVQTLMYVGFRRIIIYRRHIHTDLSVIKTSPYLSYKGD